MQNCFNIASEEDPKSNAAKLSQNLERAISCEKQSVSEYSPGRVEDQEYIARQIHSPIHVDDETGEIKSAAFDDAFTMGLSVNRLAYSTEREIHELGEKKAENDRSNNKKRQYSGFIKAKASEIRSFIENDCRVFSIYDTALKDIIHHADLFVLILGPNTELSPVLPKKAARMERRLRLKETFSNLIESSLK